MLTSVTLVILLVLLNPGWFLGFGKGHTAMKHHYRLAACQFNDGHYLSGAVNIMDGVIVAAHSEWVRRAADDGVGTFKVLQSQGDFAAADRVCEEIIDQISLYLRDGYSGNFCVNAARFSD